MTRVWLLVLFFLSSLAWADTAAAQSEEYYGTAGSASAAMAWCQTLYNAEPTNSEWQKGPCAYGYSSAYAKNRAAFTILHYGALAAYKGYLFAACPSGQIVNSSGVCYDPNVACAAVKARTEDPNDSLFIGDNDFRTISGTGATQCLGGCSWAPRSGQPMVTTTSGGVSITRASFGFTGLACTATPTSPAPATDKVPPKPVDQVCNTPTGTQLTVCKRQDGKLCYPTKFNGRQICWSAGETGTKTDGPIAQVRQPGNLTSTTPPTPPPGETMVQQPNTSPTPATTTTVVNGSTTTTTTTTNNYYTQNGTNAGSSDQGDPGAGSGGASSGDQEGDGESECKGVGTDCTGAGAAGDGLGNQYEGNDGKTYASVFSDYREAISDAPVVQAVNGVFSVSLPVASCPAISRPSWEFLGHTIGPISFDWHCTGPLHVALESVGWIMVLFASWYAFRIGFLNG